MKKVLWVDDDIEMFGSQLMIMNASGYNVQAVSTINEAVQALKAEKFDLLLLDIMMPSGDLFSDMDTMGGARTGVYFAQYVRSHFPELPVAVLSSYPLSDFDDKMLYVEDIQLHNKQSYMGSQIIKLLEQACEQRTAPNALDMFEVKPGAFGLKLDVRKFLEWVSAKRNQ